MFARLINFSTKKKTSTLELLTNADQFYFVFRHDKLREHSGEK